ncbi:MAG TPA: helix-turn-helix domain-containing protein [Negativicutes bacterium]|nr:helix-turn-helix domain-containing protein [Negativicutes bacterium]
MGITVREAMHLSPISRFGLLTGDVGLDNIIERATVLEAPDSVYWFKANDFILTTAFCFKDKRQEFVDLIPVFASRGVAAIAVKKNRFLQTMPDGFVSRSIEYNIPVFIMPDDCAYTDAFMPLYQELFHRKHLNERQPLHGAFCHAVANHGTGFQLIELLAKFIGLPVLFFDAGGRLGYVSRNARFKIQLGTELGCLKDLLKGYHFHPFPLIGEGGPGSIVVLSGQAALPSRTEAVVADSLVALTMQTIHDEQQKEMSENDLIYSLLTEEGVDEKDTLKAMLRCGLDYTQKYLCLIVALDNLQEGSGLTPQANLFQVNADLARILAYWAKEKDALSKVILTSDDVIVLLPVHKNKLPRKEIQGVVCEIMDVGRKELINYSVSIGISSTVKELVHSQASYFEASKALKIGTQVSGRGSVTFFEDLGIFRVLSELGDRSQLEELCQNSIGQLINYDKNNNTEFYRTLEMFCKENFNLKETSRQLSLHYNSLQYRLKKISEITGLDLDSSEGIFNLMVGLKANKLLHGGAPKE